MHDGSGSGSTPAMDSLPLPDFSDYVQQLEQTRAAFDRPLPLEVWLPLETARGCWWGEKRHCTFCGLNADRMGYRSKRPERALSEIRALLAEHQTPRFFVVDNILDHGYFDTLLAQLARQPVRCVFHWEIKSNLSRKQVLQMAAAGVLRVQPGIESLSTPVLDLMRKGVTGIRNVQTLKWLTELGIESGWNYLFNFPGEQPEWFEQLARILPRLMHLQPPRNLYRISVHRFSPYHMTPESFGITLTAPSRFAQLAFADVPAAVLARLAYEFEYEIPGRDPALNELVAREIGPRIAEWRDHFDAHGCTLSIVHGAEEALLVEGAFSAPERVTRLRGVLAAVLLACEGIRDEGALAVLEREQPVALLGAAEMPARLNEAQYARLLAWFRQKLPIAELELPPAVDAVLEQAEARGLLLRERGRALSLPVNRTDYVRSTRFSYALRMQQLANETVGTGA